ncbi:MAG: hypothetical protein AAF629_35240 [Chloroflexota bacterium]
MVTIHSGLANTTSLFMFVMGVYALYYYARNRLLDGRFFGIVAIGELLLIFQSGLGLLLIFNGRQAQRPELHYMYGFFSLLVLPAVYYYTTGDESKRAALIWSLTGLFLFGLSLRLVGMGQFGV